MILPHFCEATSLPNPQFQFFFLLGADPIYVWSNLVVFGDPPQQFWTFPLHTILARDRIIVLFVHVEFLDAYEDLRVCGTIYVRQTCNM